MEKSPPPPYSNIELKEAPQTQKTPNVTILVALEFDEDPAQLVCPHCYCHVVTRTEYRLGLMMFITIAQIVIDGWEDIAEFVQEKLLS
uniref:LITAF domain-containing protein n=1 Tax=Acrobeloides nanus TaxID=290746 RepID=A0A914CG95_9BILA